MPNEFTVEANKLSYQYISDILVGAFEGGSNYWLSSYKKIQPIAEPLKEAGERLGIEGAVASYQVYPFIEGNGLTLFVSEDETHKPYTLNLEALKKGLDVMKTKYSRHFMDITNENDDATTADVLLQCSLFGEIVYG